MINAEFLITSLIVVLIPGTGVIYTVSTGLFLGWRASIAAALGCTCGIIPHLAASILGLSAILHMSSLAFQVLKFAGALYLLYLAVAMWLDTGSIRFQSQKEKRTPNPLQIAFRGVLLNILNPKLSLFFLAFLPLFISPESSHPTFTLLILSLIFMAMTLVVFVVYGICANSFSKYIVHSDRSRRWLQRSFAATFAALGIKLAFAKQ